MFPLTSSLSSTSTLDVVTSVSTASMLSWSAATMIGVRISCVLQYSVVQCHTAFSVPSCVLDETNDKTQIASGILLQMTYRPLFEPYLQAITTCIFVHVRVSIYVCGGFIGRVHVHVKAVSINFSKVWIPTCSHQKNRYKPCCGNRPSRQLQWVASWKLSFSSGSLAWAQFQRSVEQNVRLTWNAKATEEVHSCRRNSVGTFRCLFVCTHVCMINPRFAPTTLNVSHCRW